VQRIVDGQNLEIKKTLTTYSHLIEQQRRIVFQERNEILFHDSVPDFYESESSGHFKQLVSKVDRTQLDAARKVGKHDHAVEDFFCGSTKKMPRTMPRYAIEKFDVNEVREYIR